jgi:FkbM family methyltransferase
MVPMLRRPILWTLSRLAFDISIPNPWDRGQWVRLNLYRHKGYWFHGKRREYATMMRFGEIIRSGDVVYEIGGHIGFITQYFSKLVGSKGQVIVFEPGQNNLPYITNNVRERPNVTLERYAVSNQRGHASFYVEDLTGQNNSLINEYDVFTENAGRAYSNAKYHVVTVECVTLDEFVASGNPIPAFIKIDIEGAEIMALTGMRGLLTRHRPILMVEITASNAGVEQLLHEAGYLMQDASNNPVQSLATFRGNLFCFPK